MAKDVKIEILYYKTSSDVSLEFGLHGNYPMRLLSSPCNDKKTFLSQLKRAVSRSEIIITIGGYNEDNIPSFIARAIGKKEVVPDYSKNGIITEQKYSLPEDAVTLASKNKLFGGFLIECGPQTIISFTDNKNVTLDIVNDFLVDYITEHHNCYGKNVVFINKGNTNNAVIEETSVVEETPVVEENIDNGEESINDETLESNVDEENAIILENEKEQDNSFDNVSEKVFLDDDDDFVDFEVVPKQPRRHNKNRILRTLCYILSTIVIIFTALAIWYFGKNAPVDATAKDYYSYAQNLISTHKDDPSIAFNKIKGNDNKIFAWLNIDSVDVNYPVYTVDSLEKTYIYLNSLPNGIADRRGMLFSTTNDEITHINRNTIIYGSANPGGIFEKLTSETASLDITTIDGHYLLGWKVLSSFTHSNANGFDYEQTNFETTDDYISYLSKIDELSESPSYQTFYGNEKLLILIAVTDNERYITVATLSSIKILSTPDYNINSSSSGSDSSVDSSSGVGKSSEDVTSNDDEEDDNDFLGNTPDIILPSIPSTPSTPSKPSSVISSSTSSNNTTTSTSTTTSISPSSSTVTSIPSTSSSTSSNTSSQLTSAQPSVPSSAIVSSTIQSSSSVISSSSSVSSSTVSKPNVDPLYTWDVMVAVKSSGPDRTGEVIVGTATEVVAWIIEIEMSPTIHPPEALIAQAVVKYNWIINNGGRCTVTDSGEVIPPSKPPQNAMQKPTKQALQYANEAKGMVLVYGNTLAKTYCHDISAGYTAAYHNVWGGGNYAYLQGVECAIDKNAKNYEVTTTYTSAEIKAVFEYMKNSDKSTYSSFKNIDIESMPPEQWLVPTKYDANNAYCLEISVFGVKKNGKFLRDNVLIKSITGKTSLRSSAYTITYNAETDTFTVTTRGHGHGVGLSQQGAILYAKQGWSAEQILAHFFPGTTLIKN